MFRRVHHIGVVVTDLAAAERLFGELLGLPVVRRLDIPGRPDRSVWYGCGDTAIELIEVIDPQLRAQRLGDGAQARIEHIALEVADIEPAIELLGRSGVATSQRLQLGSTTNAWSDPATSVGIMLQLVQEHSAEGDS